MKIIAFAIAIWLCVMPSFDAPQKSGWRGIVPLHSTRADVERLLGRSKDPCGCTYHTERESVFIAYARRSCAENSEGWNVPVDTVLLINVTPRAQLQLSDLDIDVTTYQKTEDEELPGRVYYTDEEKGLFIIALKDGSVGSINYKPTTADNALRCR
ncbi:MAG TPA: hypothetical protein VGV59_05800 [Pyrinomonadaceae bacterium]|nr:hypothetical protein [Pyrinomonadaceae bacterium]